MKKILFLLPVLLIPTTFADFSDVPSDHPYLEAIKYSKENNIVSWYKDWTFQPENLVTREEFTKIIIKSNFSDSEIYWEDCFPDVDWSDFEKYICTAKREWIIWWYKDGTFKPKDNISFLEASKIITLWLWKINEVNEASVLSKYMTIEWIYKYAYYLWTKQSIPISIKTQDSEIKRGEMIEIIWRLKENIHNKENIFYIDNNFYYKLVDDDVYAGNKLVEEIDPKTFENLWGKYAKDKNQVYYIWEIVKWADINSFKWWFWTQFWCGKDKYHVYNWDETKEELDSETFYVLWDFYIDKNWVYHRHDWKLEWANISTFQALTNDYWKDGKNVYFRNDKIDGADPETFEIFDTYYTKDKNNVYYYGRKIDWFDSSSFSLIEPKLLDLNSTGFNRYTKNNENVYYMDKQIEWADPETFELLDRSYSKDKYFIYYKWKKIEWVKTDEFKNYSSSQYWHDSKNVYYYGQKIEWVDIDTFKILWYGYAKDKNNLYGIHTSETEEWWTHTEIKILNIEWVDLETFKGLEYNYAKDKNFVYYHNNILKWRDAESFEVLDQRYTKDKQSIYYFNTPINNANIETFNGLWIGYARDKNYTYFRGKQIEWGDSETLQPTEGSYSCGYAKDKNNLYQQGEKVELKWWTTPKDFYPRFCW